MIKTPSTRSRVFSKTETFFSEYGYRPHVTGVFEHRKRRFSNTLSRVEIFENADSSCSYEVFLNTMTSCLGSYSLFRTYDSKTLRVDAGVFFKYGEKNLRFRKYPAMCGRGLIFLVKPSPSVGLISKSRGRGGGGGTLG